MFTSLNVFATWARGGLSGDKRRVVLACEGVSISASDKPSVKLPFGIAELFAGFKRWGGRQSAGEKRLLVFRVLRQWVVHSSKRVTCVFRRHRLLSPHDG